MYRFIFGASGTGKTTYIYNWITDEAVKNPDKNYFLFVPEQYTLKAQQELIRHSKRHGMLNLDVLSFNLLCYRVFDELGYETPEILDEMTKSLFLRKACQEVKDELKVYKNKLSAAGFIHQVKSIISEFYQYNVDRDRFNDILKSEDINPLLRAKLEDIGLISDEFSKLLGDKSAIAEELPVILLRQISKSRLLKDSVIIFDGFTGFTPIQLNIISYIMEYASETAFAVTISPECGPYKRGAGKNAVADLWWLSKETVAKVCSIAEKNGIKKSDDIIFKKSYIEPSKFYISADNPEDEVKKITADIAARTKFTDKSIRYKKIAVAVSETESYRELIKCNFNDAGIPFFIDDTSHGTGNVSIELIRSVLAIINNGYSYEDVLRYAKNALSLYTGYDEKIYHSFLHQADILDNYIRAKGIRGRKAYEKVWKSTYRGAENIDLSTLNEYKDKLMSPVFQLHDSMKSVSLISERVQCIKVFIQNMNLDERNKTFTDFLERMSFARESKENEEFYEMLLKLLDSMSNLLGNEEMKLDEFTEIFEAGAAELKAGLLPQTLDLVIVGDLKRSRFDNIDILYIVGANEGYLPQIASGGGIFTDQEREILRDASMELAPLDREDICIQNYYIYLLMNKPSKNIIMSYSYADRNGTAMKPSSIIQELKTKNEINAYEGLTEKDLIFSKNEALLYFSELMHTTDVDDQRNLSMYAYLSEDKDTFKRAKMILESSAYNHDEDNISKEDAVRLYGEKLYGSVTRIEAYEKCAYAHFLRYGLKLLERQQFDIEAFDIGNLYHKSIELVFSELSKDGRIIQDISENELSELSENAVERVVTEYNDQIMQSSARNIYISRIVKKITGRTLWAVREQLIKGDFITLGCEIPFSIKEDNLELRGRIDRIDLSENDSNIFVKVIDYKSGRTSFDLSLIYQGIQLQLVTYMDIAIKEADRRNRGKYKNNKTAVPGGMFYYRVTNPIIDIGDYYKDKSMENLMLEKFMPDGLVNSDESVISSFDKEPGKTTVNFTGKKSASEKTFSYLMKHTDRIIREDANKILSGDINKKPYMTNDRKGCDYCRYHSICGFDDRMEGFEYRKIYKLDEKEILNRLKREYGEEDLDTEERQESEDEMD